MAQKVKNLPAKQEICVWSLGQEYPLEKGMATHSSILAWIIQWTEVPGRLQSMGSQRVGHQWVTKHSTEVQINVFLSWEVLIQFSAVAQSCPNPCDPMNRSTPGLPVHHQLPEFTQTHVHWVSDVMQPSHPLSSPSPPAPNPCQHQDLFQWASSSHEVAKGLEFQLQHQSFQWTPRTDVL